MRITTALRVTTCFMLLAMAPTLAAADVVEPEEKIVLFDGKTFDGWFRYLRDGQDDVDATWKVTDDGHLLCTGNPPGYIRTEQAYKNYKLHLEYRWPGQTGNNGILVHATGDDQVWPKSLECQGMFQNQGDFFEIGGFEFNEHKAGGKRVQGRRVIKLGAHNEKPAGEWNVYEVWCVGDTVRPYVNGKLMNEATGCAITEGRICLQSEGVPIEFRNIYVAPPEDKPWPVVPKEKIALFNGKDLDGWAPFIPDDKPDENGVWAIDKVWSVKDGVLHCTGKPNGYIRTVDSYADYRLHVEWRWVDEPTNSGVLLHRAGIDRVWPTCVEAQLMHENAGDFWLLSHSQIEVDGKQIGPEPFANGPKKHESNEKPVGEWNTYDIVCKGGSVQLTVNGLLQNAGVNAKPSSGPICLQSEGSPIEFRNVYLEPLEKE